MQRGVSASTTVMITILDINDHVPLFDMASYQVNVSELTQVNSTIVTLMASDRDEVMVAAYGCPVQHTLYFRRESMQPFNSPSLM